MRKSVMGGCLEEARFSDGDSRSVVRSERVARFVRDDDRALCAVMRESSLAVAGGKREGGR